MTKNEPTPIKSTIKAKASKKLQKELEEELSEKAEELSITQLRAKGILKDNG